MKANPVIFREYDIRGVFEVDYDLEFARTLGSAIVQYFEEVKGVRRPKIALGMDARLSSPKIVEALSVGIRSCGGDVVRLGLVTSPITYFSTFTMPQIDGGIMVTGSHNPPEYNGFKISIGKSTIFGAEIKRLETILRRGLFPKGQGTSVDHDIFPAYIERYKDEFKNLRPMKVVLDCGNGAAGSVARQLYESVGLDVEVLFETPDGEFPNHHPDPTVEENLEALKARVRETGAVCGIGFDGDADRIGLVDHEGTVIWGDEIMALCSRLILKKSPGEKIVGDVKCSDRLYAYISKHGGKPIMWKTGHSLIKQKIKDEHAPFGGELSGHIFFADRNYGYDDALYAGLRVLEVISETGKSLRENLSDYPKAFSTPEIRIDTTEEKKVEIVEAIKRVFSASGGTSKVNLIDGIRVSFEDGWALARASNTQPVLVLRFESVTQKGLQRIRSQFEEIVNPLLRG
jgi:phosphomannomutase / phosphoglucomutase